ncbi:MAG: UMP kinase [Clostridiales bacterium]|nr:UMP kinase [Clostridiales bacterium]MDD7368312.1 UMP kinase [Clostridiales bacterium]MDY2872197.1 UMP kinase [Eubacteriales bacterium]
MAAYKRIILKLSGETLAPENKSGSFDASRVDRAAEAIIKLHDMGVQVGIVLGGGNIWRGRFSDEMNPVNADQMGMLATIINALAVQDAIVRLGRKATVLTAQEMTRFARLYTRDTALGLMEAGEIVLLSGGSGNPFFTTDTAAALRAAELNADAVFKGTTVEGVFDSDPRKNPNAKLIKDITYQEAIEKGLRVMDLTAFMLCMEQKIPEIRVFAMDDLDNILRVAAGEKLGTVVHG